MATIPEKNCHNQNDTKRNALLCQNRNYYHFVSAYNPGRDKLTTVNGIKMMKDKKSNHCIVGNADENINVEVAALSQVLCLGLK